jgi:hypothetical protein
MPAGDPSAHHGPDNSFERRVAMNHSLHVKLFVAAVIGFVVLSAFGVSMIVYLPILAVFGVCMLMMMFMMRGMDHGASTSRSDDDADRPPTAHHH